MRSSSALSGSVNRLATVTLMLGYFAARTVTFRVKEMVAAWEVVPLSSSA